MRPSLAGPASALLLAAAALPAAAAPQVLPLDPLHTYPSFEFPHMGLSVWRGKFDRTKGALTIDRAAHTGKVDVTVDTASVNFGLKEMDEHAVSADWFDVAKFPTATYQGTLKFDGEQVVAVDGTFTFRGVAKPLTLKVTQFKCMEHPYYKRDVCGADATGELNWGDYGMKNSQYAQGGMGRTVLRIQVEALAPEAPAAKPKE